MWVREQGKQAYLGGYASEEEAAEAHDVAELKCRGQKARINFPINRCALRTGGRPMSGCAPPASKLTWAATPKSRRLPRRTTLLP